MINNSFAPFPTLLVKTPPSAIDKVKSQGSASDKVSFVFSINVYLSFNQIFACIVKAFAGRQH